MKSKQPWAIPLNFFKLRTTSGKFLLAFYDYLVLYLGLAWLGVLCLGWTLITIILYPILPRLQARRLGRLGIMTGFRIYLSTLSLSQRCTFDLSALDALRDEVPLIIAPNHPSLLDAVMVISRLPNVACIMKAELMGNMFLGAGSRFASYIRNEPVRKMMSLAAEDLKNNSHLLLFPEGTRTVGGAISPFTGCVGLIAQRAGVPVQTVFIETNTDYLSKGWPLFRKPAMPIYYRIRLGRRFDPPQDGHRFIAELEEYFAKELAPA